MKLSILLLAALPVASAMAGVPVFRGFEDARYQTHDAEIRRVVGKFNSNRANWIGGTREQAAAIPDLGVAQVKSQMIQESGGGDMKSRAAWRCDPLQVNKLGDWSEYKRYLGLRKPRRDNDGSLKANLRAGVMFLSRKGFGVSGQPAENRVTATFDGWEAALRRYNGRSDRIADGTTYRDAYAGRILQRACNPSVRVPIAIR